jgi:uncharacterized NAD(P)/FAD-binding protein YdhS
VPAGVLDAAIVGGGCSATALAALLARDAPPHFTAAIFSHAPLGPGTAYAPQSAALLMNGPVRAMSAVAGDEHHLARYLVDEPGDALISRARYGAYLRATAANALAAHPGLRHVRAEAVDLERSREGYVIRDDAGEKYHARSVVLALGNLPPNDAFLPAELRAFAGYYGDPWSAQVERFDHARGVAIIGSRLTAMDTVALLDEAAFRGPVHLISRHGLLPAIEDASVRGLDHRTLELDTRTPYTLLRSVRRAATRHSGDWRAVVEALRPITPAIWSGWSARERRRFLRHLQSLWAIHRYRVPPATHAAFERMRGEGRILVHRGRIAGARPHDERVSIEIAGERQRSAIEVGYAINCTGPNADLRSAPHPFVRAALARGVLRPDALRLGIDANEELRVIAADGAAQARLFAMGPLLRGLWYETTAVGEIRAHAATIARALLASL